MKNAPASSLPAVRQTPPAARGRVALRCGGAAAALLLAGASHAYDVGPFTLSGFAKIEATRVSDYCTNCQRDPTAGKQFVWADELVQGKPYGAGNTNVTLFQPYLAAKFDLGRGFKVSGLLSQRWRDGRVDFPGFLYEGNVAVSHEDYGKLTIGATQARSWMFADYPYGGNVGVSDVWGSSGAGYGILTSAVRYTSRVIDLADGDLTLEATYDMGKGKWHRNKPSLWEFWAQYRKGGLGLDLMFQQSKNGTPSAFGHGPFTGLFYDPSVDKLLGSSNQGIAMLMGTYWVTSSIELTGGLRGNHWSGAYARIVFPAATSRSGFDEWNNPFNVDWTTDLGGGIYKGYPATSLDLLLGLRYRFGKFIASTGMVHLGAAATDNPTDRGTRNAATINTIGLNYDYGLGLQFYTTLGMVNYAKRGLSPISAPDNQTFTNIDSRLKTRGNWVTVGAVYVF